MSDAALAEFTEYFVRNYPGPDTIIYDPRWHAPKIFAAARHAIRKFPSEQVKEIDAGRFEEWSLADFAGQCRMQSREQLDPEFSRFMAALGIRLAALATAKTERPKAVLS